MEMQHIIDADTAPARRDPLRATLLESRQRWRSLALLAADMVFEADLEGKLTFVAPDEVLGWPASSLLGREAEELLARGGDGASDTHFSAADPFSLSVPMRDRAVWLRDARGQAVCLSISLAPLLDRMGLVMGTRGVCVDVTAREHRSAAAAAALRRGDVLDHILGQMRQEVLAPRMMQALLDAVMRAMGGRGAAVLDLASKDAAGAPGRVLHFAGADPGAIMDDALALLQGDGVTSTVEGLSSGPGPGTSILGCAASTRFGEQAGLVVWRPAAMRRWDGDDHTLAASVTGVIRIVLEHESIQRELARQARTDPLTGLLNRRAFMTEAARRIDRLDREGLPGTLMFVDLDRLKLLNDRSGHEAGDQALVLAADLLCRTVRPSDLVARLGGDEFAIWLDGSDAMTAAERAEGLRIGCPPALAHLTAGIEGMAITMSIGIACRVAGEGEALDSLIARADRAMYEVKHAGRGHWRVSQTAALP